MFRAFSCVRNYQSNENNLEKNEEEEQEGENDQGVIPKSFQKYINWMNEKGM